MQVRVRLFASLREATGSDLVPLEVPEGATPETVWARLAQDHPDLTSRRSSLMVAVNLRYAAFDAPLADGDELVFVPPVSGG